MVGYVQYRFFDLRTAQNEGPIGWIYRIKPQRRQDIPRAHLTAIVVTDHAIRRIVVEFIDHLVNVALACLGLL